MDRLTRAANALFGCGVAAADRLHGGDLSDVFRVALENGRIVAAKQGPMVAQEARMLAAISGAGVNAPGVLGQADDVLFLEILPEAAPSPAGWRDLADGLARLHATTGHGFGWPEDYAFGPVGIRNRETRDWCDFWAENRLLDAASDLPADIARRVEALALRLPDVIPRTPRPALLHGDLWTGNVLFTQDRACLIDPACYYGDAEVDLAMLSLFGGPGPAFTDHYPAPEPGWQTRRAVYQLWPGLVHLRLFGAGYRPMVTARLDALGV